MSHFSTSFEAAKTAKPLTWRCPHCTYNGTPNHVPHCYRCGEPKA